MGKQVSRGTGQTIVSARVSPEVLALIDEDVAKHKLGSRSAWLVKVIEARLRTAKLLPKG